MDRQQGPTVAQGTLLTVTGPPGREGGLGKKGHVAVYGWVPLLSTGTITTSVGGSTPIQDKKFY